MRNSEKDLDPENDYYIIEDLSNEAQINPKTMDILKSCLLNYYSHISKNNFDEAIKCHDFELEAQVYVNRKILEKSLPNYIALRKEKALTCRQSTDNKLRILKNTIKSTHFITANQISKIMYSAEHITTFFDDSQRSERTLIGNSPQGYRIVMPYSKQAKKLWLEGIAAVSQYKKI